jgi:glutamine synthetase
MTGRTLLGRPAAKHQQLEDHYFGSIPERVYGFYARPGNGKPQTRHSGAYPPQRGGPAQYEVAPIFEEINVAVDHNRCSWT